ncbi:MAG: enoyl-CoA hydratase/isomerase family protein [Chitinispirillaceae bacterium]|nr:enoyl-CoA hydratase/isomerase family protein [Chitinispirillaceae bacterium]
MTYEHITVAIEEGVATVTINRPRAFNVLNSSAVRELKRCIADELGGAGAVKVIILTGQGEKAFCGGADIKEMKVMDAHQATLFSQLGQQVMDAIEDTPKPVIAAVNGYALGGGLELALACDIVIASENARFASPEINVGVMTGWGCSKRLPEVIGPARAKELLFTGEMIDAHTALRLGIVNRVVPAGQLTEEVSSLARQLAGKAAIAMGLAKRAVNNSRYIDRESAELIESEAFGACFQTADQKEGMAAFEEKRKPVFSGK